MHTKQIVNCTTYELFHKSLCYNKPESATTVNAHPGNCTSAKNPVYSKFQLKLPSVHARMKSQATLKLCTYHQSSKQKRITPGSQKFVTHQSQFQKIPMAKKVAQKDERNCLQVGSPLGSATMQAGADFSRAQKAGRYGHVIHMPHW